MVSKDFPDTRLPWYETIAYPHKVSLFADFPEMPALVTADPNLSDEGWVTEAVLESYNG